MSEETPTVLVVDDEPQILRALKSVLAQREYDVVLAASGEEALEYAAEKRPDLVILDLTLPGISGLEVCRSLREWLTAPILILTVRDAEADKIAALDLGADDYLLKPFSSGEMLARIRALLRRAQTSSSMPTSVRAGGLVVDLAKRRVSLEDEPVRLTRTEFEILAMLAENADRVVTSRALLRSVWGPEHQDDTQALRVHISHLRRKIEEKPSAPRFVLTEPGVGYRFSTRNPG